jgi:quinohemoprotein ethanol dehydrogenase
MYKALNGLVIAVAVWVIFALNCCFGASQAADRATPEAVTEAGALLSDGNDGRDWPAFGRTYGEQHYSPLQQIDRQNVKTLGLAWSLDMGQGNTVSGPIEVGGTLFFATGYSVVRAVNASNGKLLWIYDPKAAEAAGQKLRDGWGIRGAAWWNGKIYVGTQDGRLIALNAGSGKPIWSAATVGKDDVRFISGPPRVFDGKVIIGHAGGDFGPMRGYVTTYDAETGRQLWRFWTVPGNPAEGFEDEAMRMAAKTWSGQWWKYGGGGAAWNAFTYDADTNTIFFDTGNGEPWNYRVRSNGRGDNLFLASMIAVDASTGKYKWHYQFNPGDTWDYDAVEDMELADLPINGKLRKVVMVAPKNGFFYVIDRLTGAVISAEPFVKVTWAKKINLHTGRPVENPSARFPERKMVTAWPSSAGGHNWQPMAYNPIEKLAYIPTTESGMTFSDAGIDYAKWKHALGHTFDTAENLGFIKNTQPLNLTGWLTAWDPIAQRLRWRVQQPSASPAGVMTTAGGLVFQGRIDGKLQAYDSRTGKVLWSFEADGPILAPPITYMIDRKQYITVLEGIGSAGTLGEALQKFQLDFYGTPRRALTFELGGKERLVSPDRQIREIQSDPTFKPEPAKIDAGERSFGMRCFGCHGVNAVSGGFAPDLRRSPVPLSPPAFSDVVRDGALVPKGMPRFEELSNQDLEDLRYYIRHRMQLSRQSQRE